jgi:hypothetical protein
MNIDTFVEKFLSAESLQKVYVHFCAESLGDVIDPASYIACMMATTPIALTITEVGISPFKDRMTNIYPYSKMTYSQLDYIKETVNECMDAHRSISYSSNIQMGGGCILLVSPKQKTQRFLKGHHIVIAMCDSICQNIHHSDAHTRIGICNILIQRIYASINLHIDTQKYITEHMNVLSQSIH